MRAFQSRSGINSKSFPRINLRLGFNRPPSPVKDVILWLGFWMRLELSMRPGRWGILVLRVGCGECIGVVTIRKNKELIFHLNHYFNRHVCPSMFRPFVRPFVRHKNFFSLKSPWNHPLTPGVGPRGWPRVPPGHTAPPEELARARRALSSFWYFPNV